MYFSFPKYVFRAVFNAEIYGIKGKVLQSLISILVCWLIIPNMSFCCDILIYIPFSNPLIQAVCCETWMLSDAGDG